MSRRAPIEHRAGHTDPVAFGRRRLLQTLPLAACGLLLPSLPQHAGMYREQRHLLGTRVQLQMLGGDRAQLAEAARAAWDEMTRLADAMSRFVPTSAVNAIALLSGLQAVPIAPELMQVLLAARRVARMSDGAFDPTIGALRDWNFDPAHPAIAPAERIAAQLPLVDHRALQLDAAAGTAYLQRRGMRLDLGGIAKLPILHAGMQQLRRHGFEQAMLDGGGDVLVRGGCAGRPWRIGLRDPRRPERLLGRVELFDGIVAASGDYERCFWHDGRRLHHVLDPRTGYPSRGPRGVIAISDELDAVNGLGPAAMVAGAPTARGWHTRDGAELLIVDADERLWLSPGMTRRLLPA